MFVHSFTHHEVLFKCYTAFLSILLVFLFLGFGYLALFPGLLSCLWSLPACLFVCLFCFVSFFVLTACLCMTLACTLDYASGFPQPIKLHLDLTFVSWSSLWHLAYNKQICKWVYSIYLLLYLSQFSKWPSNQTASLAYKVLHTQSKNSALLWQVLMMFEFLNSCQENNFFVLYLELLCSP